MLSDLPFSALAKEILDGIHIGILWFDAQHRLQFINPAASTMLRLGFSKAQGRPFDHLFPKTELNWNELKFKVVTLYEQFAEREDGERLQVSMTISSYDIQGKNGWLVELTEMERHAHIMEEEERWHQCEAGAQLARTLAHEVRNPLAGIYGASQLLCKRVQNDPKAEQLVDVIAREVKRLQNLVDRMLGPQKTLNITRCNIHNVLAHVLDIVRPEKPEKVAVRLDYDPSIPELEIDFDQMVQVFMNLIKNAFQAMVRHGGMLTLRTRVAHHFTLGSRVFPLVAVVQVIDEGEGIPPNLLDSIFYPMVSNKPEGSGLGLSISQTIVRQHGGLIMAKSEPGHTVFSVFLPLERTPTPINKTGTHEHANPHHLDCR